MAIEFLVPVKPLGTRVRALSTLRSGGVSRAPFGAAPGEHGGLNLGVHCGDDPQAVAVNRSRLRELIPADPCWLQQVHGTAVAHFNGAPGLSVGSAPVADAAVTAVPRRVLAVLTADCLPVVIAGRAAEAIGIAHAGWRGLAAGVIERTLEALHTSYGLRPDDCSAWLGPAIGPLQFEVGEDVREAFGTVDPGALAACFQPVGQAGKWLASLEQLAIRRLNRLGVSEIFVNGACTVSEPQRFYSYRRDRVTGRMATLAWLE